MARHDDKKRKWRIKGTDVYLAVMLAFIIWYIERNAALYAEWQVWFPELITIMVAILILYEIYSLVTFGLLKDGTIEQAGIIRGTYQIVRNWVNSKLPGNLSLPDTATDIALKQAEPKEETDGKQTDKP